MQIFRARDLQVWCPVYFSTFPGGADGMAEAIRVPPDPIETAEGEQAVLGQLHGNPD